MKNILCSRRIFGLRRVVVLLAFVASVTAFADLMKDSPVAFPEKGALPSKSPPDVKTWSESPEKDYSIFGTPQRSLAQIAKIQAEMLIPPAFLQRIVATLANEKFVTTQPGRDGGITLARPPQDINLLQVVEAFEGPIWLSDCVEHLQSCVFGQTCPVNRRWARLRDVIRAELESATFADLVNEAHDIQRSIFPLTTD